MRNKKEKINLPKISWTQLLEFIKKGKAIWDKQSAERQAKIIQKIKDLFGI